MSDIRPLTRLEPGMRILVGGDQYVEVSSELAERFAPGDLLQVVATTGALLHIPAQERTMANQAVGRAHSAFEQMGAVTSAQLDTFYETFAARLGDEAIWEEVLEANRQDVEQAERKGRSTTRLVATPTLRRGMIDGLRGWLAQKSKRGAVLDRVDHGSWSVDLVADALGVVGFIFEGRPNVLADATGVLRGGNTVVFRIGSDALTTARTMLKLAVEPALHTAQLPAGAISLVDSSAHAAGWAMFSDQRLALAVARGSGAAVATLGGLAQQNGIPVSLHGTGGAWLVAAEDAPTELFEQTVFRSLDRKVCNTLNTCCIPRSQAARLVPALLKGMERAGERLNQNYKLHVTGPSATSVPDSLFNKEVTIRRAEGDVKEPQAALIDEGQLGREWEWEQSPEVTLTLVESVSEAIELFNRYSPQFVASLVSENPSEHQRFFERINAPFVGDGFTRWVDGQYALRKPELGLSNWERGRLFGRAGILSGDTVFTVRMRARGTAKAD